jgi:hypothetical protein
MLCTIKNTIKYNGKRYRNGAVDLDEATASILIARGDVELAELKVAIEPADLFKPEEGVLTIETDIEPEVPHAPAPKKTKKGGKAKE